MNEHGFLVKIVPAAGTAIYRLHFRRRHVLLGLALVALVFTGLFELHARQLQLASADIRRLQEQRSEQQRKLDTMERQTQALQKQNSDSERSIERIERTLGGERRGRRADVRLPVTHASLAALAARLGSLERASQETQAQARRLQRLAARVLNFRRLATIARERMIAAIPSLNPVNGGINAAFGWRTNPFPEFHKGLDLAADYGTTVRAAGAGTVASAGWDGDFGIRVDIDHGNGYHTWYCHLSRIGVTAGQHVARGEAIASVGSTGESTGPHLHYQVMHDGVAIDPMPFLTGVPASVMASLPENSGVQ